MDFKERHIEYKSRLEKSSPFFTDLSITKQKLSYARWKVSENLDKLLFEYETNVKKNDAKVYWCPDEKAMLENLNAQLKNQKSVEFFPHNSVRHMVRTLDLVVPEASESPETIVLGAKFIIANTGNFFISFKDTTEYHKALKAKKIVVVAGIDSVLSLQSELYTARQLYAYYETGNLMYEAEILGRPGRIRGMNAEFVLLLVDLNKHNLLENPFHRSLFSLLNFDLAPVCPLMQRDQSTDEFRKLSSLDHFFYPFLHGLKSYSGMLFSNYGLRGISQFLPYEIDIYEHVVHARALVHETGNNNILDRVLDKEKLSVLTHPNKFKDADKFNKFANRNFFGK